MERFKIALKLRKVIGILILVIAGVFVIGSLVMVLWNAVMPTLFHLPLVSFWQALALFCLAKILFSGFRGVGPGMRWKRDQLKEAWTKMTPEQREKFKQEWGRRCRGRRFEKSGFEQGGFEQGGFEEKKPAE
jgi:Ca2+/H+ antiporter, TMEM165/GDT1 family